MNGYIINPAWFYWVNIVDGIKIVTLMLASISLIAAFLSAFISCADEDEESKQYEKIALKMLIVAVACIIIAIFIPTKETLIEIQIAKYATWENAEWTVDAIKDLVDYITNAIK